MKRKSTGWFGWSLYLGPVTMVFVVTGLSVASSAMSHSADQLPPNIVARVSHVPVGLGTITRVEFQHALLLAAAAEGRHRAPKPDEPGYKQLIPPLTSNSDSACIFKSYLQFQLHIRTKCQLTL